MNKESVNSDWDIIIEGKYYLLEFNSSDFYLGLY